MTRWLKWPLGVVSLGVGGAILKWDGAATFAALAQTGGGFQVTNLIDAAVGFAVVGFGFGCFGWLRSRSDESKSTVANSVWADRAAIERAGIDEKSQHENRSPDATKEGIYLGVFEDADGKITLRYEGGKSLLSFGTPGANKSTGLVVPAISELLRSLVIIDVKAELASITARKRALMGRLIVLNPFRVFVDRLPHLESTGWNPLLQLDPKSDDFEGDAFCIADALIDKAGGGGNNKFFENSAENLAAALVMWERFTRGDKASLHNIRADVSAPNVLDKDSLPVGGFLFTLRQMANCDHAAISTAGGRLYARLTDTKSQANSAQDVIDTFMASTRFLDDPRIGADMWQGGAISFAKLHKTITTIYLILPAHELVGQAKWLRLFVNIALRELYKNPPAKPILPPVLFVLDEFGNLGWLSQIETALNLARGYRVQLWMFLQNLAQLKGNYKDKWESFFTGAGAVTSFKTGDMETAEQLAKIYGNREETVPTQTPTGGTSNTPQAIPLIRPEDINRLAHGETISIIQPCDMPIKGAAPIYPKTPFAEGLDANPYFHG